MTMTPSAVDVDSAELAREHVGIAERMAFEYLSRAPRHADRDEFISAAFFGLVKAATTYSPGKGASFSTWARKHVTYELINAARAADPLSRGARGGAKLLAQHEDALVNKLGKTPDVEAIAQEAGISISEVHKMRSAFHRGVTVSLDATMLGREDTYSAQLVDADPLPLESLENRERDSYMWDAVNLLPERTREIVLSSVVRGESNVTIAERLGVSPQRIGQLKREGLAQLREGVLAQYADIPPSVSAVASRSVVGSTSNTSTSAGIAAATYAEAISLQRSFGERLEGRTLVL